jgi:hypothetical protein
MWLLEHRRGDELTQWKKLSKQPSLKLYHDALTILEVDGEAVRVVKSRYGVLGVIEGSFDHVP